MENKSLKEICIENLNNMYPDGITFFKVHYPEIFYNAYLKTHPEVEEYVILDDKTCVRNTGERGCYIYEVYSRCLYFRQIR